MAYKTLMVHLEVGSSNAALLQFTFDLARRLDAGVIGIAADQLAKLLYADGYAPASVVLQDIEDLKKTIEATEAQFRVALQGIAPLEWRSSFSFDPLADYVANEARGADLVITATPNDASLLKADHHAHVGDLVLRAGRPVLVVPPNATAQRFERVLVGWKDTREARRAIVDALPFLTTATRVIVAEVAPADHIAAAGERLDRIVAWLRRHQVAAEATVVTSTGDDAAQLEAIAAGHNVDLVVAGAYGHSRLREWVLGGVTRDLLLRGERCALISH